MYLLSANKRRALAQCPRNARDIEYKPHALTRIQNTRLPRALQPVLQHVFVGQTPAPISHAHWPVYGGDISKLKARHCMELNV